MTTRNGFVLAAMAVALAAGPVGIGSALAQTPPTLNVCEGINPGDTVLVCTKSLRTGVTTCVVVQC